MDDSFLAMSDCQQRAHTLSCALCKTSTAGGKTVYRGFDFTFCSSQCRNLVAMSNRDPQEAIKNMTAGRALDIPFFSFSCPKPSSGGRDDAEPEFS